MLLPTSIILNYTADANRDMACTSVQKLPDVVGAGLLQWGGAPDLLCRAPTSQRHQCREAA
jgi:hypothetical protein